LDHWYGLLPLVANVATAIGVCVALFQQVRAKKHSIVQFEDSLTHEYRLIIGLLPVAMLLGEDVPVAAVDEHLRTFYLYFDLTNEQVFLRRRERVSEATWRMWQEGIRETMELPAFAKAWREIGSRAASRFHGFRRLEEKKFDCDPLTW
jgi:hypothetical protein